MRIGLVQINPTVGDLNGNAERIRAAVAGAPPADLCVTSEMALTGYPARDLLLEPAFIARTREVAGRLAARPRRRPRRCSSACRSPTRRTPAGRCSTPPRCCATGVVERVLRQEPAADLRRLRRGPLLRARAGPRGARRSAGARAAVSVCEDVWNDRDFWQRPRYLARSDRRRRGPRRRRAAQPVGVAVLGRQAGACARRCSACLARSHGVHVVYVNQVGGNDDLVFDGRSVVLGPDGRVRGARAGVRRGGRRRRSRRARRRRRVAPTSPAKRRSSARSCSARATTRASAASATCCSACPAASTRRSPPSSRPRRSAREHVLGVLMPSPFSSQGSVDDSLALAERLGIRTLTLPIADVMRAFEATLAGAFAGRAARRHRGEHPGARPRQPADGAVEQVRRAAADDRQQVRAGGRLLHALRRHVGRARGDRRRAEDARLPTSSRVGQPRPAR